jgi:hypothetical protein
MDRFARKRRVADLRDHLAEERTFLARIDSPQAVSKHFSKILDWSKEAGDSG